MEKLQFSVSFFSFKIQAKFWNQIYGDGRGLDKNTDYRDRNLDSFHFLYLV